MRFSPLYPNGWESAVASSASGESTNSTVLREKILRPRSAPHECIVDIPEKPICDYIGYAVGTGPSSLTLQ